MSQPSISDQQPNVNLYTGTADATGYVPLHQYPSTSSYADRDKRSTSSGPNPTLEAALAPMTRARWNVVHIGGEKLRRPVVWAGIFMLAAIVLCSLAIASPKMYKRKFWTEAKDPVSQRLGFTISVKEKIGVLQVCYKVHTRPLSHNSTGVESTTKNCKSFTEALLAGTPFDHKSLPPTSNIAKKHHHHHYGRIDPALDCYAQTILYSLGAMFGFFAVTLAICVARKFVATERAQKAAVSSHPAPIILAFIALSIAIVAAASGAHHFADQRIPPEFVQLLGGEPSPTDWPEIDRRTFSLSCSFHLLLWAWCALGLCTLLSVLNSARQYERLHLTGTLNDPPLLKQ